MAEIDALERVPSRIEDANGDPVAGAKLQFHEAGTSTPVTVYSDKERTIALSNPVVADAGGLLPQIFRPAGKHLKLTATTAADATLWTRDNVEMAPPINFTALLESAIGLGGLSIYSDALAYRDYINATQGAGTITIDETGVADSAAGLNAWITAAVAAGVYRLYIPAGEYRCTVSLKYVSQLKIRGASRLRTNINFEHVSGWESGDTGNRVSHVEIEDMGIYGIDDEPNALSGGVNASDNTGVHFHLTTRCFGRRLYVEGFTDTFVINGEAATASGASHCFFEDCSHGVSREPHGNNNYPRNMFWIRGDLAGANGPDYCGFINCEAYQSTTVDFQTFDGDNSTTAFQMASLSSGARTLGHGDQLQVFVGDVLQTRSTDYAVSGVGTSTPTVTFTVAPATGTDNIEINFVPWETGCTGFNFEEANGCFAFGCAVSGAEFAFSFGERGCTVQGGYIQIAKQCFRFTSNSTRNYVPIQSFGITEGTITRIVSDGGKENTFLPNRISDSARLNSDFVVTNTSDFQRASGLRLVPEPAVADGTWVYRVEGDIELEQNGGSPSELSAIFGLMILDPDGVTFNEAHQFQVTVTNPGTSTVEKNVSFSVVDLAAPDKSADRNPAYELGVKAGANTQVTVRAGSRLTLHEEHYHAP